MADDNNGMKELISFIDDLKLNIGASPAGRYFTRKELKYHVPAGQFEEAWSVLKLSRALLANHLPFSGLHLTYVLTPEISEELYICDQELSKSISSDEGFSKRAGEYMAETFSEEAISSSQLEGAVTTEIVARKMLRKNLQPRNRDEMMILNNHKALQFIREQKTARLTPEFICEIQRIVTDGTLDEEAKSGVFRKSDDVRVIDPVNGRIIHNPPKAADVPALISAVCDFANRDIEPGKQKDVFVHPVICAIVLHFLIGYIHPFYDGNGRTARTLFYWYVLSRGYNLFAYLPISKIIKQARGKYRDAFLSTEEDELDLTYFILYNIKCIRRAREALAEHITHEQARAVSLNELIGNIPGISGRQKGILTYIFEHKNEEFMIDEIAARFDVVYQTARTDLYRLADLKYLRMHKRGRTFTFDVDDTWADTVSLAIKN